MSEEALSGSGGCSGSGGGGDTDGADIGVSVVSSKLGSPAAAAPQLGGEGST